MKKAPQAQAWRLSGKTFRPHTFTELQLEDSSNGFKNVSVVNPFKAAYSYAQVWARQKPISPRALHKNSARNPTSC